MSEKVLDGLSTQGTAEISPQPEGSSNWAEHAASTIYQVAKGAVQNPYIDDALVGATLAVANRAGLAELGGSLLSKAGGLFGAAEKAGVQALETMPTAVSVMEGQANAVKMLDTASTDLGTALGTVESHAIPVVGQVRPGVATGFPPLKPDGMHNFDLAGTEYVTPSIFHGHLDFQAGDSPAVQRYVANILDNYGGDAKIGLDIGRPAALKGANEGLVGGYRPYDNSKLLNRGLGSLDYTKFLKDLKSGK